jgi:hypothetical protein
MHRRLLMAGAASLALLAHAAQAQSTVTLVEAGAMPRQPLRYAFESGMSDVAVLEMNVQTLIKLGDQQVPMKTTPPIRMQMDVGVTGVATDGSAHLQFKVISAEASGDAAAVERLNQSLTGVRGLSGSYRIDPQGQVSGGELTAAAGGQNREGAQMLGELQQTMQQLAAPFPAEPVGDGARWQVVQNATSGAMKIRQTVEYTLRGRSDNTVSIDVKIVDSKLDTTNSLPPGARVDSIAVNGTGRNIVRLDRLVPVASMATNITVAVSATQGGQTEYSYRVLVKDEEWAQGVRWDWSPSAQALIKGSHYDNRFRTNPAPENPASSLTFAVMGDFGVGMKKESRDRRQQQVANALRAACDEHGIRLILTTGDNIYAGKRFLGLSVGETGDEDDDWFFTYFQPYRYVLNRVCVYPSIGNHDTAETEDHDDRAQVEDNLYIRERIAGEEGAGRASFEPGLFYRVRYGSDIEFVCIDTSKESFFAQRLFEHPKHRDFLANAFPAAAAKPAWRIPFCHHPPYSAGPTHHNTRSMQKLIPLFHRAGVRVLFSGHEHNFQHAIADGINYFVTGAAGKQRTAVPDDFASAHTQSWSSSCHFLLAVISGNTMTVRAVGELGDALSLHDIQRFDPLGRVVEGPMAITLT